MINIRNIDAQKWAVVSLMVLWVSTTFSIALMEIAFICALVFWLGWCIQSRSVEKKADKSRTDWALWVPLALFFITVLISFFFSEYPKQSFRGLLKIAKPLLVFLMASDLFRDTRSQKKFDGIFLATFLLVVIDCSFQYAFGKDILRGFVAEQSGAGLRLVGPFGNFAKMATYLVLVIPVFGMRFWSGWTRPEHRKKSFYSFAMTLAGFALLYLTRCRGPVIALVLSLVILFAFKRWFRTLGMLTIFCLVLLAVVPRGAIIHRDLWGKDQSLEERHYLWRRAIDVITAKPFSGTGINTYDKSHAKYDTLRQKKRLAIAEPPVTTQLNPDGSLTFISRTGTWRSDREQKSIVINGKSYHLAQDPSGEYYVWNDLVAYGYYAHNGYLQLTAEIGIPGLCFFLLFLFMLFRRSLQSIHQMRGSPEEYAQLGILTGLLAFLIYAAFDNNLQSPPSLMFFWFSTGILVAHQNTKPVN
jgi:O-antigen ligase